MLLIDRAFDVSSSCLGQFRIHRVLGQRIFTCFEWQRKIFHLEGNILRVKQSINEVACTPSMSKISFIPNLARRCYSPVRIEISTILSTESIYQFVIRSGGNLVALINSLQVGRIDFLLSKPWIVSISTKLVTRQNGVWRNSDLYLGPIWCLVKNEAMSYWPSSPYTLIL